MLLANHPPVNNAHAIKLDQDHMVEKCKIGKEIMLY